MDILKTPLIILFKEQNPYRILANYFKFHSYKQDNFMNINKNLFIDLYQQREQQYSKDEVENLYDILNEKMEKKVQGNKFGQSVFNLIINYAENMLESDGNNIKCKYKDLLKWRMTTLELDQDLFITSYLAFEDLLTHRSRQYFHWDTIVKSNNIRLHNMLSKGMAENHFHLKGSAPTFKLSWISLMNNINNRKLYRINEEYERLEKDLDGKINVNDAIVVAALLRVILFNNIETSNIQRGNEKSLKDDELSKELKSMINKMIDHQGKINKEYISQYSGKIQSEINILKHIFGSKIKYKSKLVTVDYAITNQVNKEDGTTRLFAGERAFMYKCFYAIYSGNKNFLKDADLFYAYLIIKNKVRGELIQQNNRVGFSNFANYQDRKTKYLKSNTILKDAVEPQAILTSIKNQNIQSIEARIIPETTRNKNVKVIKRMDDIICNEVYNNKNNNWIKDKNNINKYECELTIAERKLFMGQSKLESVNNIIENYFYVYHFPKCKDSFKNKKLDNVIGISRCRHYKYRNKLNQWGYAIYTIREKNKDVASRILGIDACANELDTRPEVYGQVFRFLKGHLPSKEYGEASKNGESIPRLRATYHVGEDFLDIIDGLRAIDEAITFLKLTHGDRLGHAIALGIDVEDWYREKSCRVHLTKQDILDNIAWLIIQIKKYNIIAGSEAIDKLTAIYNKYYLEIYTNIVHLNKTEKEDISYSRTSQTIIPVDVYMEAWKLRGDNPEYYNNINIQKGISYWDRCAQREGNTIISSNSTIVELYNRYHYDIDVKARGSQKEVFKIPHYIILVVKEIQKCMQISIRKQGIGIECNPSSNVLISNFKRYDKHPILKFNNLGLVKDNNNESQIPQMFVSINTDDQGVFDTLLENEYALMGIALEKVKDENGECVYNQSMIYDWLDRVRQMGLEQSFNVKN